MNPSLTAAAFLLVTPALLVAQPANKSINPAPSRSPVSATAPATPIRKAPETFGALGGVKGAAWGLPEADLLVQRVFARIVSQDKPGAVPIRDYRNRYVGREATLESVRRFNGRNDLAPSAFESVSEGWTDAPKLAAAEPCATENCPASDNSIWLAITKIERGELPHEVHVWYTTSFRADSPGGPQKNAYAFCERWLRLNGTWKYDGFVRVAPAAASLQ